LNRKKSSTLSIIPLTCTIKTIQVHCMNMDGGKFCVCLHTQKQNSVKYTAYPTGKKTKTLEN
jgi:hypothetical protein